MSMQKYEINFKEEKVYIGIDVHKNQWHVCVRTASISMKPFSQPPSAESLKTWLTTHFPGGTYISAYEVGFTGFSTHYALENAGIRSIVFNPGDISDSQKERSRKTDAVDCIKICRNLMNGELTPIYVPSQNELSGRGYLGARDTAVKKRQQSRQRIKSLLYRNGISYPKEFRESNKHWTRLFNSWLESVANELGGGEGYRLSSLLEDMRFAHLQSLEAGRKILGVVHQWHKEKYELLLTVPGVGRHTASRICLELPDMSCFKDEDHLAGYIGFVPDVRSSDKTVYVRGISYRGRRMLRSAIIEAAWRAISKDPALGMAYTRYIKRGLKPNNAIIRIAKKVLNRIRFVLRTGQRYEPSTAR